MADAVDIPNDTPEKDDLREPGFDELRQLRREMQVRGSLLGKTWSELSGIMDKYQARLIEKHDQVETSGTPIDHRKFETLEKRVSDLEHKLLAKDSEIVELRTEVHQYKNEVTMKDNLIEKIQNQMAKEAMEFQTEINSLKDMLDRQNGGFDISGCVANKRRKIVIKTLVPPKERTTPGTNLTPVSKSEPARSSCQLAPSTPVFPSPQPVGQSNAFEPSNRSESENSVLEVHEDALQYGAHFKLEQTDDFPEEVYAGLEHDFDTSHEEDTLLVAGALEAGQSSQARRKLPLLLPRPTGTSSSGPSKPPAAASSPLTFKEGERVITETMGGIVPHGLESDMVTCQICRTGLPKGSLISHQRTKHGLKPYSCRYCALRFDIKSDCTKHVRTAHPWSKKKLATAWSARIH